MTKALSCINTQQLGAKTISKDQQTLNSFGCIYSFFKEKSTEIFFCFFVTLEHFFNNE